MNPFRIVDRTVGVPATAAFLANAQVDQDLPRVAVYDSIWLRLTGTLTNAAYTTAPTKYAETPENLIGSIQVIATGALQDTIKAVDFAWVKRKTQFMEGTEPTRADVGTTNAAFAFETNGRLFFRSPRVVNYLNTLLDARRLAGLTLRTQWRDQTALVFGGVAGTSTLSATSLLATAREYYGINPASNFRYVKEQQRSAAIAASQTEFLVPNLPVGNRYRRICFKGTVGNSTFGDNSDSLFNNATSQNIKIRDGSLFPLNANFFAIRAQNKEMFRIETMPAGYALWEPVQLGWDSEMYDARLKQQLESLVDVNFTGGNTNTLQLTTEEYIERV
jgi:hypothetical protein